MTSIVNYNYDKNGIKDVLFMMEYMPHVQCLITTVKNFSN